MEKIKFETVEELVQQRRGYKYLRPNLTSPYQGHQYSFASQQIMVANALNENPHDECGAGWNLATIPWILNHCNIFNHIIVEFTIPKPAKIIIPENSSGKFRTDKIKYKKTIHIEDKIPALKDFQKRIKNYNPVNPIVADEMPDKKEIKKIMDSVGASVRASVRASVWASVRASVWDSVGDSVRDSVGDSVWDSVWDSVRASVRASVWDSVRDYCYTCGYYAIVKFFDLSYRHPVFNLIDLGIIVIDAKEKHMVFGKNGKHLGDIEK